MKYFKGVALTSKGFYGIAMKRILLVLLVISFSKSNLFGQEADSTFTQIEQPAEFPGGVGEFLNYISKNMKYPKAAWKKRIGGKVIVEFYVNADGTVDKDSIRTLSIEEVSKTISEERAREITTNESLVKEAIRVISQSPNWVPGRKRNIPVRQKVIFPIKFATYHSTDGY